MTGRPGCLAVNKGPDWEKRAAVPPNGLQKILQKYARAHGFQNGFAVAALEDEEGNTTALVFVDEQGIEHHFDQQYAQISDYSEGLFMVSSLDVLKDGGLAYHSDYEEFAGVWGYADSSGREVIAPQYIYAFDFGKNGLARVCKGKWTKDRKWDSGYKTNAYWSEEERWGMIDKTGKEVVPCKFDEIQYFNGDGLGWGGFDSRYLKAHYGGWENGKWGIINYTGGWVVEPVFEDFGLDMSKDGLVQFYNEEADDDVPMGLYSIPKHQVVFEPQFFDIQFLDSGLLLVQKYDEKLQCRIAQIIDRSGRPLFDSVYTWLLHGAFPREDYFVTTIFREDGEQRLQGLIDKNGREIVPCKYESLFQEILFEQKKIVIEKDKKYGFMTFEGEVVFEPEYSDLTYFSAGFFVAKLGGEKYFIDEGRWGLLTEAGAVMLPFYYESISVEGDRIFAKSGDETILFALIKK